MDLKELRQMTGAELSEKAKRSIAQVKTVQREVERAEQKKAS